jgi:hypothetical protein
VFEIHILNLVVLKKFVVLFWLDTYTSGYLLTWSSEHHSEYPLCARNILKQTENIYSSIWRVQNTSLPQTQPLSPTVLSSFNSANYFTAISCKCFICMEREIKWWKRIHISGSMLQYVHSQDKVRTNKPDVTQTYHVWYPLALHCHVSQWLITRFLDFYSWHTPTIITRNYSAIAAPHTFNSPLHTH